MQFVPVQHWTSPPHPCPKSAQLLGGAPPSEGGTPPSGVEMGGGAPQTPLGAPGVMLQTMPVQQSPVAVQAPPAFTQTMPPSLGGVDRQCRTPVASGTQGTSPQHSDDVLQVWPACRQQFGSVPLKMPVLPFAQVPEPRHRGSPSVSKAQQATLGSTAHSQSLWAFAQEFVPPVSLQMPPGTWLPWFCAQTPMLIPVGPVAGTQVTTPVSPPQQSAELVHRLFKILQPRPGWQTFTPVCAHGPQFRLQQLPHPLQSTPSCWQVPAPVVMTSWQVPTEAPEAFEQKPPQQSRSRAQTSPGWMQNEAPSTHLPPEQSPEQQPPATPPSPVVQGLPAVLQLVLSGWQVPPLQLPLQQADEEAQTWLSAMQLATFAQTPLVVSQRRLQQSVAAAQGPPGPLQVETDDVHIPEA
jgi:hypothetical protein